MAQTQVVEYSKEWDENLEAEGEQKVVEGEAIQEGVEGVRMRIGRHDPLREVGGLGS